jgi:hypothetical protein
VAGEGDWAHPSLIGSGGGAGASSGERARRRPAGTPTVAAVPARPAGMQVNVWLGRLKWCLREA